MISAASGYKNILDNNASVPLCSTHEKRLSSERRDEIQEASQSFGLELLAQHDIRDMGVWEYSEDIFLTPKSSVRRFFGLLEFSYVGILITLGIYVIFSQSLRKIYFPLFVYILISLFFDSVLFLLAAASLFLFWLLCGAVSVRQALVVISLFLSFFQTLVGLGLAVGGFFFLFHKDYRLSYTASPLAFVYLLCETLLMTIYSLKVCRLVLNLFQYIRCKLCRTNVISADSNCEAIDFVNEVVPSPLYTSPSYSQP